MVTRLQPITILAMSVLGLAISSPALAQDRPRVSVMATGGVSAVDGAGSTYGGELSLRLTRMFDVTIGAARLSDITADDFSAAASRIATLAGATAEAHAAADVFEGGVRLRLPIWSAVQPYAAIGGGRTRITTETTFFKAGVETKPGALGIALGPELNSEVTKGVAFVGAGIDVSAGRHIAIDAGVRYSGIVSERDESPRYHVFPVLRFQVGIGVRF